MKKPFLFAFLSVLLCLTAIGQIIAAPTEVVQSGVLDMQAVTKTVLAPTALEFQVPVQAVVSDTIYDSPAVYAPPGSSQMTNPAMTVYSTLIDLCVLIMTFTAAVFAYRRLEVNRRFRDGLKRLTTQLMVSKPADTATRVFALRATA